MTEEDKQSSMDDFIDIDGGEREATDSADSRALAAPVLAKSPSAVAPKTLNGILRLAEVMAMSGQFKDIQSAHQAAVRIIAGQELGLGPFQSISQLYVIDGKVTLMTGLMSALIKRHPNYDYRVIEHTEDECIIEFYENGQHIGTSEFTMHHASQAGLIKPGSAWEKYPRNMLFARALSNGARWFTPDVFGGSIYTPDELGQGDIVIDDDGEETYVPSNEVPAPARTPHPGGYDVWQGERCPLHDNEEFFMRGRMRQPAHPIGRGKSVPWCNYEDVKSKLWGKVTAKFDAVLPTDSDVRKSWVLERLPDLEGVATSNYRIADLLEIERLLDEVSEKGHE